MVRDGCRLGAIALVAAFFPLTAWSQTYSYIDANGIRTITNIPPAGPVRDLVVYGPPGEAYRQSAETAEQLPVDSLIEKYARQYQLDPDLIRSMIRTESGFNPRAVSPKGAQGLMQLMPETAARLGVKNPFDPEENIRGGVQHMRNLLDTFNNDLTLSLAAYNAGENLVQRLNRIPDYRETHDYVRTVTKLYGKKEVEKPAPDTPRPQLFQFIDRDGVLNLTNIPPARLSEVRQFSTRNPSGTPE